MNNHITKIYHGTLPNVEPDIEFKVVIDCINKNSLVDDEPDIEFKEDINICDEVDITMKEHIISSIISMWLSCKEKLMTYRGKAGLSP